MRAEWLLLLTAVQFLTRCPVPAWVGHSPAQLNQAVRYFPLVGLGVGSVGAVVLALAGQGLPALAAAALAVMATVLLTGAFHEDGLADTCDGLFGGWTREDALRIMKDSRLGTFGVAGLGLVMALKVSLLADPWALLAASACSRFMAVGVIAALPYVRASEEGARAKPVASGVGGTELAVAALCGLLPMALMGARAIPAVLLAAGFTLWMALWFRRRLGGYTGDGLGAVQQVTEVAILAAARWQSPWLGA